LLFGQIIRHIAGDKSHKLFKWKIKTPGILGSFFMKNDALGGDSEVN
jgi:hypothetical protein